MMMKASTFFLGLATGTVAAAVTVLYSTPRTGNELRSSLKCANSKFEEPLACAKEQLNNVIQSISTLTKEAKENLPGAINGIKQSLSGWQQVTEPHKDKLEEELSAIQEAIENLEKTIIAQKNE